MRILFVLLAMVVIVSCSYRESKDIVIGITLYENSNSEEIRELKTDIDGALSNDVSSYKSILAYDCGGAAGCYDLGFVIVQILDKVAILNLEMVFESLFLDELFALQNYVRIGKMYGDTSLISLDKINSIDSLIAELIIEKNTDIVDYYSYKVDSLRVRISTNDFNYKYEENIILDIEIVNISQNALDIIYDYGKGSMTPWSIEVNIIESKSKLSAIEIADSSKMDSKFYSKSYLDKFFIDLLPGKVLKRKIDVYNNIYIGKGKRKLDKGTYDILVSFHGNISNSLTITID